MGSCVSQRNRIFRLGSKIFMAFSSEGIGGSEVFAVSMALCTKMWNRNRIFFLLNLLR